MSKTYERLALGLSFEFHKFLMQRPDVAKQIPRDSLVVVCLDRRPGYNRWARGVAAGQRRPGQRIVEVRVRYMSPPVSRIQSVELALPRRGTA